MNKAVVNKADCEGSKQERWRKPGHRQHEGMTSKYWTSEDETSRHLNTQINMGQQASGVTPYGHVREETDG